MGQQLQAPVLPGWTLGDRLRKARTHASLGTTGDMARRLGVHRNSVINYEAGRIVPPLEIVVRYSRLSHIPLEWFVGEFDDGEEAVTGQYRPLAPIRRLAFQLVDRREPIAA